MQSPNFIVFLTDDQGYGDLSCMGATDFRTPHLDRLASEGTRFTDWYSNCPVCSPSRASLLTGRYPGNAGVRSILAGHRTATGLPQHVPTLATALKNLDYQTYMAGKWHLGVADVSRPHNHGFDRWFGFLAGCIDYYSHIFYWDMNRAGPGINPVHDLWEDNQELWQNGDYFTEVITDKTIEYLRQAKQVDKPFFLYVPYNAPHYPMHAPQKYMDRFSDLPWDRQVMAAMLSAMDDGVGAILADVERLGMAENTCTLFTSNNGPSRESRNWLDGTLDPYYGGKSCQFKGHKFSLYEGGVRVPGILHWPGRIPAGQTLREPCASMDIFPTFLTAAGADPSGYEIDGSNILPYVVEGKIPKERDICWEMDAQTAIRRGKWKLVLNGQLVEGAPPEDAIHLSNLEDDPAEEVNLKDTFPEIVQELSQAALSWREGVEQRWDHDFSVPAEDVTIVTY
ncbi:MAG: sulfatase-like hydrolase/transferase [bacterium]|nr:sulfatase-like hydrolase/transferase [bacterium]